MVSENIPMAVIQFSKRIPPRFLKEFGDDLIKHATMWIRNSETAPPIFSLMMPFPILLPYDGPVEVPIDWDTTIARFTIEKLYDGSEVKGVDAIYAIVPCDDKSVQVIQKWW